VAVGRNDRVMFGDPHHIAQVTGFEGQVARMRCGPPSYHLDPRQQPFAAQAGKGELAAGQNDDLLVLCDGIQGGEHRLDPVVVAVDQRIVKDYRHRAREYKSPNQTFNLGCGVCLKGHKA